MLYKALKKTSFFPIYLYLTAHSENSKCTVHQRKKAHANVDTATKLPSATAVNNCLLTGSLMHNKCIISGNFDSVEHLEMFLPLHLWWHKWTLAESKQSKLVKIYIHSPFWINLRSLNIGRKICVCVFGFLNLNVQIWQFPPVSNKHTESQPAASRSKELN